MTMLGEFLARGGEQRRQAGVWDCCTMPADWAVLCGEVDPMAKWRGAYSTEAEAEHLIFDAGGLVELFAEGMGAAGIPALEGVDFRTGDIGVVDLAGQQAGAIYTGKRWAFVPERGIGFVSLEPECIARAWRPRHG